MGGCWLWNQRSPFLILKRRSRLDPLTAKPALGLTAVQTQLHPHSASLTEAELMEYLGRQVAETSHSVREKLLALAGLLDTSGWCVAGQIDWDSMWLGANARLDLALLGELPSSWPELQERIENSREQILVLPNERLCVWAPVYQATPSPKAVPLTKRENEILALLRTGLAGREIAVRFRCAPRTIEKHISNIYRKIGVNSRPTAILPFFSSYESLPRR